MPTETLHSSDGVIVADGDGADGPLARIAEIAKTQGMVSRRETKVSQFTGPLPPPELFRLYGEVIPDAPERILRVFEEDSRHIREVQREVLHAQRIDNRRVHWMAYSLILGGFVISLVFAMMKEPYLAGTVLGTTLLGTIGGLVNSLRGTSNSQKDSEAKSKK